MRSAKKPIYLLIPCMLACVLAAWPAPVARAQSPFEFTPALKNKVLKNKVLSNEGLKQEPPRIARAEPLAATSKKRSAETADKISAAALAESVVLNSRSFGIPFNVDRSGSRPVEVRLFVSRGPKTKWKLLGRKSPGDKEFDYKGQADGLFWFATRTVDSAGQAHPSEELKPQLKVVVDTTKPTIELKADADASGRIKAQLKFSDVTPIKSIQIHYASDVLREWTSIDSKKITKDGNLNFLPEQDWQQLSLQIICVDSAGNQSIQSLLLQRPRIAAKPKPKFAFKPQPTAPAHSTASYRRETPNEAANSLPAKLNVIPTGGRLNSSNGYVHQATQPQTSATAVPPSQQNPRRNPFFDDAVKAAQVPAAKMAQNPNSTSRYGADPRYSADPRYRGPQTSSFFGGPGAQTPTGTNRPAYDPRQTDPRSLTFPTAPSRTMSIAPKSPSSAPFGPPSVVGRPPTYPPMDPNAPPIPPSMLGPAMITPSNGHTLAADTTAGSTPTTGQVGSGLVGPATNGIPAVNSAPAINSARAVNGAPAQSNRPPSGMALPSMALPETQPHTSPTFASGLPPSMPSELNSPDSPAAASIGAPQSEPNSRTQTYYPTNTQTDKKNHGPRTIEDAMRPLEVSKKPDVTAQKDAGSGSKHSSQHSSDVDSTYRSQRPSQSDFDRAMLAGRAPIRYSDANRFSLDYEIEAVGAGGTKAVELYGSIDGGRSWSRWGTDPDMASPFDIETKGEGTFAFRIVVVSRNGLASPRPLSGDTPDIVVVVDDTKPNVKFTDVVFGEGDRSGSLVMRYSCEEAHLMKRPIALSFSDSVDGPWTTIAAGLRNEGEYVWPGDPELPRQIFLRIDAKDNAGNVGTYVLRRPIDSQGLAPRARIRGFRTLSKNGYTAPGDKTAAVPAEQSGLTLPSGSFK